MNCPALNNNGTTTKKMRVVYPQTRPWRRVLLEPVARPMGAPVMVVWRGEALRDPVRGRKHVEAIQACMQEGETKGNRPVTMVWCGGYCICIFASAFSTGPLSVSDVMPHILPPGMPFSERQRGQRLRSNSQGWHRGRAAVVCR